MTREQRTLYGRAVWDAIRERRGTDFPDCMPSSDWSYLCKLLDDQVPLAWVLQGISECKEVKSLLYAKPSIEREISRCQRASCL